MPEPAPATEPQMFRSRFNSVAAVIVWLLCAGAIAAIITSGGGGNLVFIAPVAFIAWLVWLCLLRPAVLVSDDGVRLINVLSTIDVPWPALIHVDTKYSLVLHTPHGKFSATAAPAPGRMGATLSRSDAISGNVPAGPLRPGDSPRTDSGAAAYLVRSRWKELTEAGRIEIGVADTTAVSRSWHWVSGGIAALLLIGSLILLATI